MKNNATTKEMGVRLKSRAKAMQITPVEIGAFTGASSAPVSTWLNGKSVPRKHYLKLLAQMLKTTPQWILTGNDDSPDHILDVFVNTKAIGRRIQEKMWDKQIKRQMSADHLGVSITVISSIINGKKLPKNGNLKAIAELLDTTAEWIMTGQDESTKQADLERARFVNYTTRVIGEPTTDNEQGIEGETPVASSAYDSAKQKADSAVSDLWSKAHQQGYNEGYAKALKDIAATLE